MTVTAAIKEAYAVQPQDEFIYETLELDHPAFEEPIRIVSGTEEDMELPLEKDGEPETFIALQVNVIPPGSSEDGPTPMRLRVDNVSSVLLPYLRAATQSTKPISVTYRAYASSDLSEPGEVITGLELREVTMTAVAVEATLGFREIEMQNFPLFTYDEQYYPALQSI